MEISLIVLSVFLQVIECNINVLYSADKKNYTQASQHCHALGGQILPYGRPVVQAADNCKTVAEVWLAPDWLLPEGCFQVNLDSASKCKYVTEANSFQCATLCSKQTDRYIGVTNGTCACFADIVNNTRISDDLCDKRKCGTKTEENCGTGVNFEIYKKVISFGDNITRQTLQRSSKGLIGLHRRIHSELLNFFCLLKGSSSESNISCATQSNDLDTTTTSTSTRFSTNPKDTSISTLATTTTNIYTLSKSATRPSTLSRTYTAHTPKARTTVANVSPSLTNNTTTMIYDDIQHARLPEAIIAGIAAAVLVIICLLIVGICVKQRMKKQQKDIVCIKNSENSPESLPMNSNYESPPEIKNQNDDGVYDHTNHTLIRHDDTSGNIYDHSYTVESVYDSAAHAVTENTYGYGSTMSSGCNTVEGVYDSTAGTRAMTENTYGYGSAVGGGCTTVQKPNFQND